MKRFISKSKEELINSTVLKEVLIISLVSIVITVSVNIFKEELFLLLVKGAILKKLRVQKFWSGNSISNLSLYVFAGQIALAVLVGTAISFVAHLLENKNYGYKIKEILTYRFTSRSKIIIDYVFINFMLIFLSLVLLLITYSEIALLIIFCVTLYNTLMVFITIVNVFFSEEYLKEFTISMIRHELDSVMITQKGDDFKIMNMNYSKVDSILNRIKSHTFEVLRGANYEEYIENVNLVCKLGVELEVESTDDIMTSILYGWFIEKIATFLYDNKFDDELVRLANHKLIKENCNPKLVKIKNIEVAEMYSSHYCQAFLRIHRYNFLCQIGKEQLDYEKSVKLALEGYNEMYNISQNFNNPIYSNMNKDNWSNFIIYTINQIKLYDKQKSKNIFKKYISELNKASEKNPWVADILNTMV